MITVEKHTQITILCTFKDKEESEFFDFDVSRKGDIVKSENLYNQLSYQSEVLAVNYFIGNEFVKGFSKILNCN
jgi:hypothetical protein